MADQHGPRLRRRRTRRCSRRLLRGGSPARPSTSSNASPTSRPTPATTCGRSRTSSWCPTSAATRWRPTGGWRCAPSANVQLASDGDLAALDLINPDVLSLISSLRPYALDSGLRPARQRCTPAHSSPRCRSSCCSRRSASSSGKRTGPRWPGLVAALLVSIVVYGMPVRPPLATAVYGAAYGLFPDRLDHPQRGLPLQPDRRDRAVRDRQGVGRAAVRRSAHPGAADRVLVRRVHRGRGGVRHAGGDLGGAADGPRVSRRSTPPACRSSPTPRRSPTARSARRSSRSARSPGSRRIC